MNITIVVLKTEVFSLLLRFFFLLFFCTLELDDELLEFFEILSFNANVYRLIKWRRKIQQILKDRCKKLQSPSTW